jgi:predicted SAM-dependent methyltransferase
MKTYLNLGCGSRYHKAWTNIDFVSIGEGVQAHNLLQGIPFSDESFEVVYHSHVLEHFGKTDAINFIRECHRVLKKGGIIRIAVPDLERIAKEYIYNLEKSLAGDSAASADYDWILLELYDQTVRNQSGGEMKKYLFQDTIPNEDYVFGRIGEEGRNIRNSFLANKYKIRQQDSSSVEASEQNNTWKEQIKNLLRPFKYFLKRLLFSYEIQFYAQQKEWIEQQKQYIEIGKFRLGGEIHQWMYDRYSLSKLLSEVGFEAIQVKIAFESAIPDWDSYELESKNGVIFKPDSLFIEAIKSK